MNINTPYSYEKIIENEHTERESFHFRVRDGQDNRVATCYVEENAQLIVNALNNTYPDPR